MFASCISCFLGKAKVRGMIWANCPLTCWCFVGKKQSDQWQSFLLTVPQLGAALISSPMSNVAPPVCFFPFFFFFLAFWRRTQDKRTKKNKGKRFHGIQNLWLNHMSPFSNLAYLIFAEGCPSEEPAAFLIDEESSLFCSKCLSFPFLKSTRLNKVLANACFWVLDLGLEGRMLVEQ